MLLVQACLPMLKLLLVCQPLSPLCSGSCPVQQQQEAWQLVCGKTRKAKRREAVGPYAVADGAAAPEDAADGAARAIAIP